MTAVWQRCDNSVTTALKPVARLVIVHASEYRAYRDLDMTITWPAHTEFVIARSVVFMRL